MIKSDLILAVSAKLVDVPERKIAHSVNHLLNLMSEVLCAGQRIEIRGFGSFSVHYHGPRNAHNPKTGEHVVTTGKYTPHFKPGKELRDRINATKSQYPIEK